jgi:hypothetical protein
MSSTAVTRPARPWKRLVTLRSVSWELDSLDGWAGMEAKD